MGFLNKIKDKGVDLGKKSVEKGAEIGTKSFEATKNSAKNGHNKAKQEQAK